MDEHGMTYPEEDPKGELLIYRNEDGQVKL